LFNPLVYTIEEKFLIPGARGSEERPVSQAHFLDKRLEKIEQLPLSFEEGKA